MFDINPATGGWRLGKNAYTGTGNLAQLSDGYKGGPASTTLLIDRKGKSLNQLWTTTLYSGDDQVIGTMGPE